MIFFSHQNVIISKKYLETILFKTVQIQFKSKLIRSFPAIRVG